MSQSTDSRRAVPRSNAISLMATTPSFARASGHVSLKFVSDVLTYRGRDYSFRMFGAGLGITPGRAPAGSKGGLLEFVTFATLPVCIVLSAEDGHRWILPRPELDA
ncbi:hypothetical protein ACVWVY_006070 [Bradyrhizobium sp. URHC0002]